MSYLVGPRITFSGQFQADVSTVNNDVRHYSNKDFQPSFQQQEPSYLGDPKAVDGGWWNPDGSGAFRLINCTVKGALWADGTWVTDSTRDPALGLFVGNALGRSAGKMVDLDPQMQMVSAIWGMGIRLTDGSGPGYVAGDYWPTSFRDIQFRQPQPTPNQQSLGAAYTSVLQNLVWNPAPSVSSRVLEQLRNAVEKYGPAAALSIRFSLYKYGRNYIDAAAGQGFTFGNVVGAIGVALPDEPKSFVLGRRFAPTVPIPNPPGLPPELSYFDAVVDEASSSIQVDLGNTLPLDEQGNVRTDLGTLCLGVLTVADTVTNGQPSFMPTGASLTPDQFVRLGVIPYTEPGWLETTAGIVRVPLSDTGLALIRNNPLALIQSAGGDFRPLTHTLKSRETVMGYLVRADEFVQRLNPNSQHPDPQPTDSVDVSVYAAQWGAPLDSAGLVVQQAGADAGEGATRKPLSVPIPIPIMGWPLDVLTQTTSAFAGGRTTLTATAVDPQGARRSYYTPPKVPDGEPPQKQPSLSAPYMNGQIYTLLYSLQETSGWTSVVSQQHVLDSVYIHVRDGEAVKSDPSWEDVAPLFTQYGNLYPVMSKRLVDLSRQEDVNAHAAIIELAFALDMNDPNYMPVTRDISPAQQQTLLAYLRKVQGKTVAVARGVSQVSVAPPRLGARIPVLDRQAASAVSARLKEGQLIKGGG